MVPKDLNIGFQGLALIQGQIYNPVNQPWIFEGQSIEFSLEQVNHWSSLEDKRLDHLSNQKNPDCLGYTGDGILPTYIGIINHNNPLFQDPF